MRWDYTLHSQKWGENTAAVPQPEAFALYSGTKRSFNAAAPLALLETSGLLPFPPGSGAEYGLSRPDLNIPGGAALAGILRHPRPSLPSPFYFVDIDRGEQSKSSHWQKSSPKAEP